MECENQNLCGGCLFRDMSDDEYRKQKEDNVKAVLHNLKQQNLIFGKILTVLQLIAETNTANSNQFFDCLDT